MGRCLSQTCFSLFIFSLPVILCPSLYLSSLNAHHFIMLQLFLSPRCPSSPPCLFSPFPPPFSLHLPFPPFSPTSPLGSFNLFSSRCHLFILPRCLLRFLSILLHLWLFFLSVHRSVLLPPLGGNGKSDISYLVNGERWRERERERDTQWR